MKLASLPRAVAVAIALAAAPAPATTPPPANTYREEARVAYIRTALLALERTSTADLERDQNYVRSLARGTCSAGASRLRVECLMVAIGRYCKERSGTSADQVERASEALAGCRAALDVMASNALADELLIPTARRYQITRENLDYRKALAQETRRIQGDLAVDFRLHGGESDAPSAMAEGIDRFCRDTADSTSLPYQACVSSLVWFVKRHG
jgi:hypothetical protein